MAEMPVLPDKRQKHGKALGHVLDPRETVRLRKMYREVRYIFRSNETP